MKKLVLLILLFFVIGGWSHENYRLPDDIYFAGQRVPTEFLDVQNRLDYIFQILIHDRRGHINLLFSRWSDYIPKAQKILKENGVHPDFAYIIAAESDMQSRIYSPAKAAGPWQFVISTAKRYGLRVNEKIDERNLLEKSTEAASEHIKWLLSDVCSGDVFLALACYNNGDRAVKTMLEAQNVGSFWEAVSNYETSLYVPRVIILKEILSNPEKYGFVKPNVNEDTVKYAPVQVITGSKKIDYKVLAGYLEVSFREFYLKNPHLLINSYKEGGYLDKYTSVDIFVPVKVKDTFIKRLADSDYLSTRDEKSKSDGDFIIHTVTEDTLAEIAFKYGLDWRKIAIDNDLEIVQKKGGIEVAIIKKGQKLKIYKKSK